jgi:hypothetical protein
MVPFCWLPQRRRASLTRQEQGAANRGGRDHHRRGEDHRLRLHRPPRDLGHSFQHVVLVDVR